MKIKQMSESKILSKGDDEHEELRKICQPVIEYIQRKYGSPHHRVIVDWSSAILTQDLLGVDVNPSD